MTGPTNDSQRDPALERAWRAHSAEAPPAELDQAILAAAHRAVDSKPSGADASRPQRWWMPLAAAAAIGVVVIGMLQVAPLDQDAMGPIAVIPDKAPSPAALPPPTASTSGEERQRAASATEAERQAGEARPGAAAGMSSAAPSVAPAAAPVAPPVADAARRTEKSDIAVDKRDLAATPAARSAAADEARQPGSATPRAPEPFPAAAPMKSEARSEDRGASNEAPLRESAEKKNGVTAPLERSREREAASAAGGAAGALRAPAPPPPPAAHSPPPRPAPATSAEATNAQASAAPMAKLSAATQAKARDPEAWITRIRRLRDEGRTEEAAVEMREFRAAFGDAEQRLPPDLRDWMKP